MSKNIEYDISRKLIKLKDDISDVILSRFDYYRYFGRTFFTISSPIRSSINITTRRTIRDSENNVIWKYNGGLGAILCSSCRTIIETNILPDKYTSAQYCEKCKD